MNRSGSSAASAETLGRSPRSPLRVRPCIMAPRCSSPPSRRAAAPRRWSPRGRRRPRPSPRRRPGRRVRHRCGEAERHDAGAGSTIGPAEELGRPRRAFRVAAPSEPEREQRAEELLEARRAAVVGGLAQRDADVLELALDLVERGDVAGAVELRAPRQHVVGVVVGVAVAVQRVDPGGGRGWRCPNWRIVSKSR